jgi:nicotinamidase-related amidase
MSAPSLHAAGPGIFVSAQTCRTRLAVWEGEAFANACRATCKRIYVLAGMTTDISVVGLAISALEEGFTLRVVCDTCGSGSRLDDAMAWRRM